MARILLADDDAAARDLVQRALAVDGHTVTCTQDGAEALEQLQSAEAGFDVLIADVPTKMGNYTGIVERGIAAPVEMICRAL